MTQCEMMTWCEAMKCETMAWCEAMKCETMIWCETMTQQSIRQDGRRKERMTQQEVRLQDDMLVAGWHDDKQKYCTGTGSGKTRRWKEMMLCCLFACCVPFVCVLLRAAVPGSLAYSSTGSLGPTVPGTN